MARAERTWDEFVKNMPAGQQELRSAIILNSLNTKGELDAALVYEFLNKHDLFSALRNEILKHQSAHGPQTGQEQRVGAAARQNTKEGDFYDRHPELKGDGAAIDNRNVINQLVEDLASNKPNQALTNAFKMKFPKPQPGQSAKPKMDQENRLVHRSLPRPTM